MTAANKSFVSGVHLWLVMMKAHRALERISLESIASTGICFTDFAVLEALLHKGPLPVNTLAPLVNLTSGSMTTAVDRLENRGLVRRATEASDRRTRVVHLTAEGRRLIEPVFAQHSADMEQATAALNSTERRTLVRLLKKLGKPAEASGSTTGRSSDVQAVRDQR